VFSMASYRASAGPLSLSHTHSYSFFPPPPTVRIVVADGGSSDETKKRIKKLRAQYPGQITVITSKRRGRSYQLNAGAEAAIDMHEASILLFLHADTWGNAAPILSVDANFWCPFLQCRQTSMYLYGVH